MKKVYLIIYMFFTIFMLYGCNDKNEQSIKVNVISSSVHKDYVYKEKTMLITSKQTADEVSHFFEMNLNKEDILKSYLSESFFEEYVLITGYVNTSYLDKYIEISDLKKLDQTITVTLVSNLQEEDEAYKSYSNLSYHFFVLKVNKDDIPSNPVINVEFENNSTYAPLAQQSFNGNIDILNIHEIEDYNYQDRIKLIESIDDFNELNDQKLSDYNYDNTYFESKALILASYTYSSYENVVSIMGLTKKDQGLNIVVSTNAPTIIDGMFRKTKQKLFIIEVKKESIQNINTLTFENYNLFNGDSKSVYDNNNITAAEEITYDTVEVYDNLISPIFLYKVDSLNKLNEIKEIHNKLELDISYLNKSEYSADFFEDYNLMVLNLSYPSSDGNVGIYKLINHGSYLEIITTSENSKDGDQSYDFKERVFVIKVEKNITITGLSHSIEYLKD